MVLAFGGGCTCLGTSSAGFPPTGCTLPGPWGGVRSGGSTHCGGAATWGWPRALAACPMGRPPGPAAEWEETLGDGAWWGGPPMGGGGATGDARTCLTPSGSAPRLPSGFCGALVEACDCTAACCAGGGGGGGGGLGGPPPCEATAPLPPWATGAGAPLGTTAPLPSLQILPLLTRSSPRLGLRLLNPPASRRLLAPDTSAGAGGGGGGLLPASARARIGKVLHFLAPPAESALCSPSG
mmetsp:Transcript_83465/g.221430  ORF Transcript_83465/g.221430 Transcript_83465/m.221430 type:complete len:239 (-) Transcript_83465:282-998(-)